MKISSNTRKDFLASGIRSQAQALLCIHHTLATEMVVPDDYIKDELKLIEANIKRLRKHLLQH